MKVLLPTNTPFDLNQPTSKLIDNKMCVFDYSDKEDMDFYFKKISCFINYRYPTVTLSIGDKYNIELPLNWRILITNNYDYICQLVPVEELLHFQQQTAIFNPYYIGVPKIVNISIKSINPTPVEHFVPRLPRRNFLALPLGNKSEWETTILNKQKNEIQTYPDCLYCCDDLDQSKCELDLWQDIIGG